MGQFFSGIASLIGSLVVVFGFAWVARALLGARELTWTRLMLASLIGIAVGSSAAAFLVIDDLADLPNLDAAEYTAVALPLELLATMGAIVVLELLFSRRRGPRRHRRFRPWRSIRLASGVVRRGTQVSRILARQGLAPLIGLRRGKSPSRTPEELARRARVALEEAGGMFIKLGQLLATRPDIVPPAAQAELGRLQSSAAPLGREVVEGLIEEELGRPVREVFDEVDWDPLGSASVAQAHAALLLDGTQVVIKVRRPGLREIVARDLAITRWLARTAARRTTWGAAFDVQGLADEFAESLETELDFRIEANSIEEAAKAAADEPMIRVPRVFSYLTTDGLLVMERLAGTPFSQLPPDREFDGRALADALTSSQVGAMLHGDRFHGDPHPGNILLLDDGGLGLIDFGISGRLDAFERASVFQMLVAIRLEQPTLLYESMVSIGAVDPAVHEPEEIERVFARFMAQYLGPDLPPPEAFIDLLRIATDLGLRLPRSTMAMFRALATLTGTLEQVYPGYPVIESIADLGGDEFRRRMTPSSMGEYVQDEWAQLAPLLSRLPRHVDRLATILEHGRMTTRTRLFSDPEDRRFFQATINRIVLTFLSIGAGVVSVMLISLQDEVRLAILGDVGFLKIVGWIGLFIAVTLLLRVLLAVLRSEEEIHHP